MATKAYTYDDALLREDLLDLITNLTPQETQLFSGLGSSEARSTLHEWGTDTLDAVGTNAKVEGADSSGRTLTNPSRLTNHTQILEKVYNVTDTERAVQSAGFEDRLAYEADKAFRSLANDIEYALMRGSLACGTGSAARQLKGIKRWFSANSNNYTAQSGTSLSESMLNDYFQEVWDDGTMVNAVYAPMRLKRRISSFTAGSTKNVDAADRRLFNAVDIYEADAAQNVKLFAHRYVQVSGDNNYDLVGINEDLFRIAYLRRPKTEPLSKVGDATRERVVTELTLECYHEDAGFFTEALL